MKSVRPKIAAIPPIIQNKGWKLLTFGKGMPAIMSPVLSRIRFFYMHFFVTYK